MNAPVMTNADGGGGLSALELDIISRIPAGSYRAHLRHGRVDPSLCGLASCQGLVRMKALGPHSLLSWLRGRTIGASTRMKRQAKKVSQPHRRAD